MLVTLLIVAAVLTVYLAILIPLVIWAGLRDFKTDAVFDEVPFMVLVFILFGVWLSMALHG